MALSTTTTNTSKHTPQKQGGMNQPCGVVLDFVFCCCRCCLARTPTTLKSRGQSKQWTYRRNSSRSHEAGAAAGACVLDVGPSSKLQSSMSPKKPCKHTPARGVSVAHNQDIQQKKRGGGPEAMKKGRISNFKRVETCGKTTDMGCYLTEGW